MDRSLVCSPVVVLAFLLIKRSGAKRSAPIRITLGGLLLLPDRQRYYESFVPNSIAAAILFTSTTKKSHAYVTVIDGLIILDPGRASGFRSHHHIDEKSPRAPP